MTLSKLLENVEVTKMFHTVYGQMVQTHDATINSLRYDSRKVRRGDLFVALKGASMDGAKFINDAVHNGAMAVVMENDQAMPDSFFMHVGVIKIVVPNARIALARLASTYYGHPSASLSMIGVTGTNGKTTTTHLIRQLLENNGTKTGLIGTIEYIIGTERLPASHTTPESVELQEVLAKMKQAGCSSAVMEVSSHALDQHRVAGIDYRTAVFTNLTQDHLDYHGTIDAYYRSKKMLFEQAKSTSWSVINIDDEYGVRLYGETSGNKLSYGISASADIHATDVRLSPNGSSFIIAHRGVRIPIETPLLGRFNIFNAMAAYAAGVTLELPAEKMRETLKSAKAVPGRFEQIPSPAGWLAIIDYAHTPDALKKALTAIADVKGKEPGRIITVFGCGGNRDAKKRPMMGEIASEMSAVTIVTSDNPRHEDPQAIINDIMKGVRAGAEVITEPDRSAAVRKALTMAKRGDVVLLAGKGHEDYQIIGDTKIHLSDRELVEDFLRAA
ncbi:MAG TPA: UDP-N-acetylmuramoyl-L-alanyl-D-glutamate--2,6-diaminopimelate ligase [Bacteroidota bacterium]|nr:UDP-N-acetylmuramoyl-L-alanyl-D-glutamate--2,6-diaminopimelate ligase [Bacteroidota bacterium]